MAGPQLPTAIRPRTEGVAALRIWAAGVVYAIGQVNFLFDRAQDPHATADELSQLLGEEDDKGQL